MKSECLSTVASQLWDQGTPIVARRRWIRGRSSCTDDCGTKAMAKEARKTHLWLWNKGSDEGRNKALDLALTQEGWSMTKPPMLEFVEHRGSSRTNGRKTKAVVKTVRRMQRRISRTDGRMRQQSSCTDGRKTKAVRRMCEWSLYTPCPRMARGLLLLDYVGRQDKKDRKQLMLEPMPLTSMLCKKEKKI